MPSRRSLPTLSIFSRRSITASCFTSSDPNTPSVPPTPPARLHLRNILPTSPHGMPTPPPPPRQPYPWLWQCHSCNTVYRIGCTRRCLICSHEYCVSSDPPKTRRGKKRRRSSGMCASEFDYSGWAEWGAWRRKVLGYDSNGRSEKRQREQAFADRTHNCMIDCDFPSECHHERYRLHTEALEKRMLETLPEEPKSPSIVASVRLSPDDDLPLNEALEILENEKVAEEPPQSPKSPLGQKSFFWEETDEEDEDSAWWDRGSKEGAQKPTSPKSDKKHDGSHTVIVAEEDSEPIFTLEVDEEDKEASPPCDNGYIPGQRCESRLSNRESPKRSKRLTCRNLTEVDKLEYWDESSESDSDGGSTLSSPSSSSSLDGEWVAASDSTPVAEAGDETDEDVSDLSDEEEIDEELEALIKAGKSFLRD
ncbi:hypothetical protein F5Y04DRAFT_292995 [Hypomontagnella monticulosa]|nr:hypothetical protein F5Y04DRAFT_292995 [Hypomontagnella monticulosa]